MDTEEDDENLRGLFSNEVHFLDVQSGGMAWRKIELKKKKEEKAVEETAKAQEVKTTSDGIFTGEKFCYKKIYYKKLTFY
jgi:hypothetical protein